MTWAARRSALITATGALVVATTAMTVAPAAAGTGPRPAAAAGQPARTVQPMAAHTGPYALSHAATAGPRAHRAGRGVTGHRAAVTPGQQADVHRYWTPFRMAHAMPLRLPGPGITGGATTRLLQSAGRMVPLRAPVSDAGAPARPARSGQPARPRAVTQRAAIQPQYAQTTDAAQWTGGGAVGRTSGKVFFTMSGQDYVCSGSTVASGNAAVVITAAHCVKDGTGAWATNWTFVPDFSNGNAPYGGFTANQFYVASQWSSQGNNDYDVAFVTVNSGGEDGSQVPVVQAVGGQGISFSGQPGQETAFGYPADPPYNGGSLYYCSGTVHPDPYHETDDNGLACAMTEGSSGGPWLARFNPATGTGTITAVSSFKYSNNSQILYGAPLGSVAQSLYQAAQSS